MNHLLYTAKYLAIGIVAGLMGYYVLPYVMPESAKAGSIFATGIVLGVLIGAFFSMCKGAFSGVFAGSATTLFVGNLSFKTTEEDLGELFGHYGKVKAVRLMREKQGGRSRGFGFVEMKSHAEAIEAIDLLNNTEFMGRSIRVNEAKNDRPFDRR